MLMPDTCRAACAALRSLLQLHTAEGAHSRGHTQQRVHTTKGAKGAPGWQFQQRGDTPFQKHCGQTECRLH